MANTLTHGKLTYALTSHAMAHRTSLDNSERPSYAVPAMNMAAINAHAVINFYAKEESLFADDEDVLRDVDEIISKPMDKLVGESVVVHSLSNDIHRINGEIGRIQQVLEQNMALVVLDRSSKQVKLPLSKLTRNLPLVVKLESSANKDATGEASKREMISTIKFLQKHLSFKIECKKTESYQNVADEIMAMLSEWATRTTGVKIQAVVSGLLIEGEDLPMFNTFKGLGPQVEIQVLGYFDLRTTTAVLAPGHLKLLDVLYKLSITMSTESGCCILQ